MKTKILSKKILAALLFSLLILEPVLAASSASFQIDVSQFNGGGSTASSGSFQVNGAFTDGLEADISSSASFNLATGLPNLESYCGNGIVEWGEQCDDGFHCSNNTSCLTHSDCAGIGDGYCLPRNNGTCSSTCQIYTPPSGGGGGGGGGSSTPPPSEPPAEEPPAEEPPVEEPPVEEPPIEEPPVVEPPVEEPPVEEPPAETPPAETPPAETPPATEPTPIFHEAAPEPITEEIIEIIEEENVEALEEPLQEIIEVEIKLPEDDACKLAHPTAADSDGDGLSDRSECYIGTNPASPDTDGDGCWDGEEMNRFYTSPLSGGDCSIAKLQESVIITDPQPYWIVSTLDISGIMPVSSRAVGITAFPAVLRESEILIKDLEDWFKESASTSSAELSSKLSEIKEVSENLGAIIEETEKDYSEIEALRLELDPLLEGTPAQVLLRRDAIFEKLLQLNTLKPKGFVLGYTNDAKDTQIAQAAGGAFRLAPLALPVDDIYDLVATAILPGGGSMSSAPVRVTLDSSLSAPSPVPEKLA
ncbi:MAG: hypothetical protein OEZ59_12650, partial [Deltaproteobacteria bacterium]|nr:hypothetical protein [Deltaproteobacteria bacterium]